MFQYKNSTSISVIGSFLAMTLSLTSVAQESFTISGPVAYYYNYSNDQYIYGDGTTFQATVFYSSSAPLTQAFIDPVDNWAFAYWASGTSSIRYTIFDSSGNAILHDELITTLGWTQSYLDYSYKYRTKTWGGYDANHDTGDYGYGGVHWYDWNDFSLPDEVEGFFTYPEPLTTAGWDVGNFYAGAEDYGSNYYFSGSVAAVIGDYVDTDGDGIKDDVDACDESDLSATVVVGGNDSKVGNTLLGNGCTITDMIKMIRDDESIHGQRVSGVADFLNAISNDGVITGRQRGAIQNAVARAK
ncbi:MAG: hypothetical protein Q8S94_14825 [Pseudohongiella sp.]|nr:hypothetical protein [Pseudohongiella sp.]